MNIVEKLSLNMTNAIEENVDGVDKEKSEVINYGLYLIIGDFLKLLITFSLAFLFDVVVLTIISLIAIGLLRTFAGGVHAKSWSGCLATNILIITTIILSSMLLKDINIVSFSITTYIISFLILYKYAPSDHENKPVVGKKHIKKLRLMTFSILTLQILIATFINIQPISNIIIVATIINTISVLPITYKLTGNRRGTYYFSDVNQKN